MTDKEILQEVKNEFGDRQLRSDDMVLMLEFAPPFRWRIKVERFGPLTRVIWAWFSVSYIGTGVNQMAQAFRLDERDACNKTCRDLAKRFKTTREQDAAYSCAEAIHMRSNVEFSGGRDKG